MKGGRRPGPEAGQVLALAPEVEPAIEGPALLLEVGSTATRATLLDRADGRHRFVASGVSQTELALAAGDVILGLRGATSEVERVTRRRLADSAGLVFPERTDGSGLDGAVVTVGTPLRIVLVALGEGQIPSWLPAALDATGVVVVETIAVDPRRPGPALLERLAVSLDRSPDMLLVLGLCDRESEKAVDGPLRCLAQAVELSQGTSPAVVLVGSGGLGARLQSALGQSVSLRLVDPKGPLDPMAAMRSELRRTWQERLTGDSGGFSAAQSWAGCPLAPTAESFATSLRFLAVRRGRPVWGLDVGSSTLCLVRATADSASIRLADVGIARQVQWALAEDVLARLGSGDLEAARDSLWARRARPWTIPETPEEQALSQALTREAVRTAWPALVAEEFPWGQTIGLVVVRGGGLALAGQSVAGAWAIAAGLGTTGTFELALDRHAMLPGLGALATVAPQAAADALLADGLLPVATLVVASGRGQSGELAAHAELRRPNGPVVQAAVRVGSPAQLPLRPSEVAELSLSPERGFDFGWGRGRQAVIRVRGGTLGVLLGVREVPARPAARSGRGGS